MDEIYSYKATVRRVDVATRAADLMALAKSNSAYDPAIFDERTPFFWSAEVSNSQIDAYYTWMMPSTLRNFAAAARAGVSFLNSHRHNELPFGRSLDGQLIEDGERQRVVADFFTLPGLNLNGVTTDDFILGVRSGIVSDVSVGFHSGTHWCGICQQNYLSWDCPHLAGMKFEVKDKGLVTCTVGIDDANLSEVSGVYDGATPDATIQKAQRMAEAGELKPEAVRMIEQRYRIRLNDKRTFAVAKPQEGKKMELEQQFNQIREVLGVTAEADVVATIVSLTAETERLRTLQPQLEAANVRIAELTPQAADGATYRTALIEEALAEGVRANGDKFNRATYEAALRNASLDLIRQMKGDWAAVGDSRFAGGRKTVDSSQAPAPQKKRSLSIPPSAHKV
jgi:hypothetical protein